MIHRIQTLGSIGLLCFLMFLLVGCSEDSTASTEQGQGSASAPMVASTDSGPSQLQSMVPEAAPKPGTQQVVIDNFSFSPAQLTIAVGSQVTWVNHDDVPHTVTSTTKPRLFNSGALDTDDQFSHTFPAVGTYNYFCALHPKMTAQIVVK